jgi:hypothetical protein
MPPSSCGAVTSQLRPIPALLPLTNPPDTGSVETVVENYSLVAKVVEFVTITSSDAKIASANGQQLQIKIPARRNKYSARHPSVMRATGAHWHPKGVGVALIAACYEVRTQMAFLGLLNPSVNVEVT